MSIIRSALTMVCALAAGAAHAGSPAASESWGDVRAAVYEERPIQENSAVVTLNAPYRAKDDRRTDIGVRAAFEDGRSVKAVTLIIDDNPMPVSAVFDLAAPQPAFETTVTMRMNGPSMVRAVVEADDGSLHMVSTLVKTSGVGACAAAPTTGVEEALARLGGMELDAAGGVKRFAAAATEGPSVAKLDILHPQHSGMQMDQITLLYILARYVETIEVWADDEPLYTMTGSISVSEDPSIAFTYPEGASEVRVRMTDTEGATFEKRFPLGGV